MNLYYKIKNKIQRRLKNSVEPPSYEFKKATLNEYKNMYGLNILVETGTFLGDNVDFFKDSFDKVYSIELSEELANKAIKRFKGQKNVQILQGDSGEILNDLILNFKEPALFWLDGHYSSEFFLNGEYIKTARGDKNTPIEKELNILLNAPQQHIILIDDARLFSGLNDYPSIALIRKKVKTSIYPYQLIVESDIIRLIPK